VVISGVFSLYITLYTSLITHARGGRFSTVPRVVLGKNLFHGPHDIYPLPFRDKW
jgi:hypothetical protein